MNTAIQYSLLRILLFLASLLVLWLLGVKNPLWLLLAAATVSMLLSVFLLSGLRERMSVDVAERVERRRERKSRHMDDVVAEDGELTTGRRAATTHVADAHEDPDSFR